MYGKHNSSRHRSYNSRVLGQGTDKQRYRNADWESTGEARERTEAMMSSEGIKVALENLRARYEGLIGNPSMPVDATVTQRKIDTIRGLINKTGATHLSEELRKIEYNFRAQGHLSSLTELLRRFEEVELGASW